MSCSQDNTSPTWDHLDELASLLGALRDDTPILDHHIATMQVGSGGRGGPSQPNHRSGRGSSTGHPAMEADTCA